MMRNEVCTSEMGIDFRLINIAFESAGRGELERVEARNKIIVEQRTCLAVTLACSRAL